MNTDSHRFFLEIVCLLERIASGKNTVFRAMVVITYRIVENAGKKNLFWYHGRMSTIAYKIACVEVRRLFRPEILQFLSVIARDRPSGIYLAGGTVRDLLLGRKPADVDITLCCHAGAWARELARLAGGTFVELGREEDAGRVVWRGETFDFSSFRSGAVTIEQELAARDLSVNAMALSIDPLVNRAACRSNEEFMVIDVVGGRADLAAGVIRLCSAQAIRDDPLRLLRVFRFGATLDFSVEAATLDRVERERQLIARIARERIAHELDIIMESRRAGHAFSLMAQTGLLFEIMPELLAGVGMEQPASHHLDVFDHLLETLRQAERIERDPGYFFPGKGAVMQAWLARKHNRRLLKWAALFHDLGKPASYGMNEDKGGRITFYNHDRAGVSLFAGIAERLRWSGLDIRTVSLLIGLHMRPFFLANNARQDALTLKACLRLVRKVENNLPGLFMLAMADALAGKGEDSPEKMEQEVAALFERLYQVWREHVVPVNEAKPLLTGRDLIDELGLAPGPMFRHILDRVREAQMEHRISTRTQALALAAEAAVRESANSISNKALRQ